jgi:SET domain-containing protein
VPKSLPHRQVYTRIAVSKIHGFGVRAIVPIKKGTYIFYGDDETMRWVHRRTLRNLSKPIQKLYDDFCVQDGQWLGCPQNFNRMAAAWYLNDSKNPNVAADRSYRFYALRGIREGEELTVDYGLTTADRRDRALHVEKRSSGDVPFD